MQENTNKIILRNSGIMYVRLVAVTICVLFTTRCALKALGVDDFGIFSVVGSVVSFISIINTIMLTTSRRYMSVAIGKGDLDEANKTFNVNLLVHIGIAFFTFIVAYPIGLWYINHFINYDGDISKVQWVFFVTVIGSIFSFVGVPFGGLLHAKERFPVASITDIVSHALKLGIAISLIYFFENKLLIYSITISILSAAPTVVYWIYCKRNFHEIVRWRIVREKRRYLNVFVFSGWVAYGAVASVGKQQGAALLVNAFFNTAMNAALGIANSVNGMLQMFANNISSPMAPQITKSYVSGNRSRVDELLVMSTKFSFMVLLFVSSPFFISCDWILQLWLGRVPEYAASFIYLLIIDALITSLVAGINNLIFASGRIKAYQIIINTIRLLSILGAYLLLKSGGKPASLFYSYIAFNTLAAVCCLLILKKTLNYSLKPLLINSYLPCLYVLVFYVPWIIWGGFLWPIFNIALTLLYVGAIVFFVGFNSKERGYFLTLIKGIISK